jgi:hypothetical protein
VRDEAHGPLPPRAVQRLIFARQRALRHADLPVRQPQRRARVDAQFAHEAVADGMECA